MSKANDVEDGLLQVVWSIVRAACRAIERPLKGREGSTSQIKAVVLNAFVDKEYNRNDSPFSPGSAFLGVTFMFSCTTLSSGFISLIRSVVTVAGHLPALEEAVVAAAKVSLEDHFQEIHFDLNGRIYVNVCVQEAITRIDLGSHDGGHPRQVLVDSG